MLIQTFVILYKLYLYITTFFTRTSCCMQILIEGWRWLGVQWCKHIGLRDRHVRLTNALIGYDGCGETNLC